MIPLRDVIPSRTVPFITVTIIVLNGLAWLFELSLPEHDLNLFLRYYGVVPADFWIPSLITSMFLHGGWMHVIGNMWYLWIFGDNVEDSLGHGRFIVFYLLCGIVAAFGQILIQPDST
ncbi:MAG TPA: rhomboid family intramembrane serine protease, partial [Vicinamibacterales bacterium]|nr:rhomboid family intramembrane serine protease [Vicinamibacterales bacterium]